MRPTVRALLPVLAASALAGLLAPSSAEAKFVFPYNHPDLKWYSIETDHFVVHYPVSRKSKEKGNKHYVDATFMAKRTAKVSEEMWEPMCEQFDYYLTEKVHIVLLDQSDDLEGFTIPAWNWVEISGNPGGYFYRMRGRMEWFSDVLVHEFAHVVSLKRNAAIAEGSGAIIVGGIYNDGIRDQATGAEVTLQGASEPFWWSEGGAEYWSDQAGYNWWTSSRDANLRTTVLEDRLLTYDEWVTRQDKSDWGDGERGYQQGYSIGLYMRGRFGDEIYAEMSKMSGKRWRADWEKNIEIITGVTARQIYADWVVYLKGKYEAEYAQVKAEGEVVGAELEAETGAWVARDPDARDEWQEQPETKKKRRKKASREAAKHATGTWEFYPRVSDDGKWIGQHSNVLGGFAVSQFPEEALPAISGRDPGSEYAETKRIDADTSFTVPAQGSNFGHAFDFVPGQDKMVVSGNEKMVSRGPIPGIRGYGAGYDWGQIFVVDLKPTEDKRKHRDGKETYQRVNNDYAYGEHSGHRTDAWRFTAIPNTERGADPSVSPDGKKVAYFEYADGTNNLVVINLDGTEKTYITEYDDGTWLQGVDWSPDGTRLVFSMLRNFRQDLYTANADGSGELVALNRDEWEDQDAHWAKDGSIWFSSDPDGIFNIFRYDPATGKVTQMTNVIGAAECPYVTPQGNLFYTGFTAHGWKNFALSKDEYLEKDATGRFDFTPDQTAVKADLAYTEDLSGWEATKEKYPFFGTWMSPTAYPILRFDNDSMTNFGLSVGAQVYAQDFVEDHVIVGTAMVGEDPTASVFYSWQGWYLNFGLFGVHQETKYDYGFQLDDDDNPDTTDDQSVVEGKQNQYVNAFGLSIDYPINPLFAANVSAGGLEYGFRSTDDTSFQKYMHSAYASGSLNYSSIYAAYNSPNPRSGFALDLNYSRNFTDITFAPYNGRDSDDGQVLDKYSFNQFTTMATWHLPVPKFWIDKLGVLAKNRHALTFDAQFGYIDRNVSLNDEFRGGGTHPYFVGSGATRPNNQFSGYPGFSLSGETMAMMAAAYRFPIARQISKRYGPLYLMDVYAQFGGTAGNFWSFQPPPESDTGAYYYDNFGQRVAYDPDDVKREIPFVDKAYKNGNSMLFDVNAEVRVNAALFGENGWNSFVRLAYGFNRIKGIGDVNGDDIQDTTQSGLGDALSNETEDPGLRVYVGLGTGW